MNSPRFFFLKYPAEFPKNFGIDTEFPEEFLDQLLEVIMEELLIEFLAEQLDLFSYELLDENPEKFLNKGTVEILE